MGHAYRGDVLWIFEQKEKGRGKNTSVTTVPISLALDQINENIKQAQVDKWSYLKSQVVPFFEEIITAVEGSKFTAEQLKSN